MSLTGKVALISGSSAGIGAAIARELSKRGASVIINYPFASEKAAAERVQKSLTHPENSIIVEADLSTLQGPQLLVDAAEKKYGKITILVNNAGIMIPGPIDDADDEKVYKQWDLVVNLNGRGTYLLTRAALKILSREHSRIINITSGSSRSAAPNVSVYAGTKGMIETFSRTWAVELPRQYGCTVNAIAPGLVGTEGFYSGPPEARDPLRPLMERTPVASRVAYPEEIAWSAAMLCEEGAGWINGVYLPVTGGSVIV